MAETVAAPRARLVIRRFKLKVIAGPDKGKVLVSDEPLVRIGTHPSMSMVLEDRKVSGAHCELQVREGKVTIRDFSRNGTSVDGVHIEIAELANGQTLALGDDRIRFEVLHDRVMVSTSERTRFGSLAGSSLVMREAFSRLERAAASDSTVLLVGETGTGKEGAARAIHDASARRDGPFVVVDCSALPPTLLESELFGYAKGSHNMATTDKAGAFEAAHGGTVFLDEIGELPIDLQPKLLRILENRMVKRIGASKHATVDIRFVAATNRDLRREVNDKRFREDLFYRLNVLEIRLPPLRERLGDLGLLVDAILEQAGVLGRPDAEALRVPKFLEELSRHRWSGNVRELRNYIERCLVFGEHAGTEGDGGAAVAEEAAVRIDTSQTLPASRVRWLEVLERQYLEEILRLHGDNVTAAAKTAGLSRVQIHRRLKQLGLR